MRLSEVLNNAPDTSLTQVENFLGYRRVKWGRHKKIQIGTVIRNYFCRACKDIRTYSTEGDLYCLVTGESTVSIDVTLRCPACHSSSEAWFIVRCEDDLYSQSPSVRLERFAESRNDAFNTSGITTHEVDDLFIRAQIAFDDHLGAGSMIYLRKIFEITTIQTALATGIATTRDNGRRKDFFTLLKEVDQSSSIVPVEFSENGYKLFSELSEVIHGDSDEDEALRKYDPCRKLIFGIVSNVRNKHEFAEAMKTLGWNESSENMPEGESAS